jgi:putative membrane protein
VLVVALAAHGVMSKVLYADPLLGVGRGDAELGAQVMYYGGDLVDLALMVLLGAEWYRESGRRLHAGKRGRRRPAPRIALPRISLRAARIEEGRS